LVYNIKSEETRLVYLIPTNNWGGAGLLGVTIRLDNYGGADERLIRILTVEHNSPASIAGLVPEEDYLLGTVSESLESTQSLADLLMAFVDTVVEFYVYNTQSDIVRVVPLMPTLSWGGKGLLGAEVGTGYLHRLPKSVRSTGGSSLERKVRYIANNNDDNNNNDDDDDDTSNENNNNKHDNSNNNSNSNNNTNTNTNNLESNNNSNTDITPRNLEHEPQLELEASEEGGPVTLASPDDVADMETTPNNRLQQQEERVIVVENTTEQESLEEQTTTASTNNDNNDAALLFAGPPPTPSSSQ